MKQPLRIAAILAVVALAGLGGHFAGQASRGTHTPEGVSTTAMPALMATRLPDTDGVEQPLTQWQGKVLVVNFWATWCPPCIKEIPEFSAVSRAYADKPVQFVGLSIDTLENVRDFRERFDVPYPLLIGSTSTLQLAVEFGNAARALPFTVIVDRDGAVRDVTLGTLNERELTGKIEALLHP